MKTQRDILNFTPGPQGITSPLGVKFTPSFTPRGEHSLLFRRMEGEQRISPPGDNFTWGQSLPLGDQLRMGLFFYLDPRGENDTQG
jgi:hypothetical protein